MKYLLLTFIALNVFAQDLTDSDYDWRLDEFGEEQTLDKFPSTDVSASIRYDIPLNTNEAARALGVTKIDMQLFDTRYIDAINGDLGSTLGDETNRAVILPIEIQITGGNFNRDFNRNGLSAITQVTQAKVASVELLFAEIGLAVRTAGVEYFTLNQFNGRQISADLVEVDFQQTFKVGRDGDVKLILRGHVKFSPFTRVDYSDSLVLARNAGLQGTSGEAQGSVMLKAGPAILSFFTGYAALLGYSENSGGHTNFNLGIDLKIYLTKKKNVALHLNSNYSEFNYVGGMRDMTNPGAFPKRIWLTNHAGVYITF